MTDPQTTECPNCQHPIEFELADYQAGGRIDCPLCGQLAIILRAAKPTEAQKLLEASRN